MRETKRKKLAIIDGKSVFYRGYYAMPFLSTSEGIATGGVFGFSVMALEVLKRLNPDYVAVAWDKPKTNIRKRMEMYPAYKAGRKPPPADFYEQIPILHDLLSAFGWPLYELDDYEADDIMGTLAIQASEKDIETLLITSDLDVLQLVNEHVHVYAMKKGLSNIELFRPESFILKYGIKPEQFLDLKALKGDSSDNIPGVPGIGEKTAIELLKEHKTLDGVYENLVLIKDSTRKKLEAGKELAYLSKKIGAIWLDAPIKLNLKEVDGSSCDLKRVKDTLNKLEFKSLVRQLPEAMRLSKDELTKEENETSNFEVDFKGKQIFIHKDSDLKKLDNIDSKEVVVFGRAAGKHGRDPLLLIIGDTKSVFVLDLGKLDRIKLADRLNTFFEKKKVVGYDLKLSYQILLELNIKLPKVSHDVLVGAFLINSLRKDQTLSVLAENDLGYAGSSLEALSSDELAHRATDFSTIILSLVKAQRNQLKKLPQVEKLAHDIEWPVISVIANMEHQGIKLDTAHIERVNDQLEDIISDLEQKIYGHANNEFNIASPAQLADILFKTLKLPTTNIKKGKTGYSTAASELAKLHGSHPIIDLISQYREVTKLKNTYVDTLPSMVDAKSRLHTTFSLTVAQTGRLSSNDPNLQNIPVRTDLGREIRTAFVANRGNLLISADYSQFELRLAAYLSDDKDLIGMFNNDVDVHVATAAQIHHRNPEDVTKTMRRDAKVVNFGVMYGLSTHGLVQATGMSYEQAKQFIDKYFEVRLKLHSYIESIKEQANSKGYVENLFGRRRPTPDVHSSNFMVREGAMRAAVNMPFQGSAADIMKLAMIAVNKKLTGTECKILLQIHDSLILECPEQEAEQTASVVKKTMEEIYKLPVKLTVDTAIGKNWGEL